VCGVRLETGGTRDLSIEYLNYVKPQSAAHLTDSSPEALTRAVLPAVSRRASTTSAREECESRLPARWIRSSDGVYRPAPMACATPAAVVMVACRGKTFPSSTRCASSSPSEQQSPTTSSL
jgi:hypothetical protein